MKRYISFLSILVVAFGVNYAVASDCGDRYCDFDDETIVEEDAEISDVLTPNEQSEQLWTDYDDTTDDIDSKSSFAGIGSDVRYEPVDKSETEIDISSAKRSGADNIEIVEEYTAAAEDYCKYDYNCPFDTSTECAVWYRKPIHNQSVSPRSPHLNSVKIDGILQAITFNGGISTTDSFAEPLLERYRNLMRASKTCCTEGLIYKLRQDNAEDEDVYGFLIDDANSFGVGARCIVMTDAQIAPEYSYGVTGGMVSDVRNSCICKNRQWFDTLLQPFYDLYKKSPGFEYTPFEYTYLDSLKRKMTVSVNQDVQNVMNMLKSCPD